MSVETSAVAEQVLKSWVGLGVNTCEAISPDGSHRRWNRYKHSHHYRRHHHYSKRHGHGGHHHYRRRHHHHHHRRHHHHHHHHGFHGCIQDFKCVPQRCEECILVE